ncbi:Acetyltransferase (GNAT) family protein [Nonomuraea solani]|uniref:Acetyltransferase (GNAT) family protein n=1 Tax=Nonomuraea solani TaxID=1144553 RepID=A0A1H6EQS3_9ACTN|nr:GNAT family N-acetyltransferase [Nonomuraea solani]SEH00208.1 Acetyltransferase (GNAT) family protein [Nonomuraea solani]
MTAHPIQVLAPDAPDALLARLNALRNELRRERAAPEVPDALAAGGLRHAASQGALLFSPAGGWGFLRPLERGTADCQIEVRPAARRQGLARLLLGTLLGQPAAYDVADLRFVTQDDIAGGAAVMRRLGAEPAGVSREYRLDLSHATLRPPRPPAGLTLHEVRGRYPASWWPAVSRLKLPLYAGRGVDPEEIERALTRPGLERRALVLVADEPVALHEVLLTGAAPELGHVDSTVVAPDRRGRGLARYLKEHLIRDLRDHSSVRTLTTTIEGDNPAMERLNAGLGFRLRTVSRSWHVTKPACR